MIKKLSFWNTISRILFLLLTPAFFRIFNFGFIWLRFIMPIGFFASSVTFFFLRLNSGEIEGFKFMPGFFSTELNRHYQHIWMYDTLGALLLGILLEKRWACKNLCFMGSLSSIGSSYSRLIPVLDIKSCNHCKKCESTCPVNIAITDYIDRKSGLVTDSECLLYGKCVDVCNKNSLAIKFIWNRKQHRQYAA